MVEVPRGEQGPELSSTAWAKEGSLEQDEQHSQSSGSGHLRQTSAAALLMTRRRRPSDTIVLEGVELKAVSPLLAGSGLELSGSAVRNRTGAWGQAQGEGEGQGEGQGEGREAAGQGTRVGWAREGSVERGPSLSATSAAALAPYDSGVEGGEGGRLEQGQPRAEPVGSLTRWTLRHMFPKAPLPRVVMESEVGPLVASLPRGTIHWLFVNGVKTITNGGSGRRTGLGTGTPDSS